MTTFRFNSRELDAWDCIAISGSLLGLISAICILVLAFFSSKWVLKLEIAFLLGGVVNITANLRQSLVQNQSRLFRKPIPTEHRPVAYWSSIGIMAVMLFAFVSFALKIAGLM
jgi:hypothetical protein